LSTFTNISNPKFILLKNQAFSKAHPKEASHEELASAVMSMHRESKDAFWKYVVIKHVVSKKLSDNVDITTAY